MQFLILCLCFPINAQEKARGLSVNSVLIKVNKANKEANKEVSVSQSLNVSSAYSTMVQLPFFDNFTLPLISTYQHYPDTTYWSYTNVYVNSILSLNPPEYGVASLGILGQSNSLYSSADSLSYMASDTLTSNPINLNYPAKDNIYLSFYYQPRNFGYSIDGNGKIDSLLLDFYYPITADSGQWENVWKVPADITDKITVFNKKMIPIDSSKYLQAGFRFRFHNLTPDTVKRAVSPDSIGIWNLANVFLDTGRNVHDSLPIAIIDTLPFIDDFSRFGPYPDPKKWADRNVFINSTFPLNPPTIGVATFDALNSEGLLYNGPLNTPFQADILTSNTINLTGHPSDSVYLSFFYEPEGIGGPEGAAPDTTDSLILDFFNPDPLLSDSSKWHTVWSVSGRDTAIVFNQVLIPIIDPIYFNNRFRFRFRNYATIHSNPDAGEMSNGDFWHIDYVRLAAHRNYQDTAINDVAMVYPMSSLLLDYQAIPPQQFYPGQFDLTLSTINAYCKNNNSYSELQIPTVDFKVNIKDMYTGFDTIIGATVESDTGGRFFSPPVNTGYTFNSITSSTDSALFEVEGILSTNSSDVNKWNDTAKFLQVFKNYYAYDDGSAESGYGIEGNQSNNAMVAMQFTTYNPDTLTGLAVYFEPTYNNVSLQYSFTYAVWNDNNGQPGQIIHQSSGNDSVHYGGFYIYKFDTTISAFDSIHNIDTIINGVPKIINDSIFITKIVPKPEPVPGPGIFYVGWIQTEANFLNVGLDLNTNLNPAKLFVNYQTPWQQSAINGTVMMRPVVGNISQTYLSKKPTLTLQKIILYPNPANNYVTINGINDNSTVKATIYNITGHTMFKGILSESNTINTSNLPDGMYIVVLQTNENSYSPVKLLIKR